MNKKSLSTSVWLGIFVFFSLLVSTNVIGQVQDTTPPSIVGFSFTPDSVNVSAGDQTITITLRIIDDITGFGQGSFCFTSPSAGQYACASINNRISGDALDGIYQTWVTIPPLSESGVWHFSHGLLYDQLPNTRGLSEEYLIAQGFPTTFTVGNQPPNQLPVALCQNVTVPAGSSCTALASIDNGSFDPDSDPIKLTQSPPGPYSLGNTFVTLTVTDNDGASSECGGTVTVVDTALPTITNASATPSVLWPPNQKKVDVMVNYNATDNCGQPACQITGVTSNERIGKADYAIVDAHRVRLRADRLGSGNGRIYTITITCTDASGNWARQAVAVTVPHDQGKK
jgi:hypothetical protein